LTLGILAAVVLLLSVITLMPRGTTALDAGTGTAQPGAVTPDGVQAEEARAGSAVQSGGPSIQASQTQSERGTEQHAASGIDCAAGKNGGSTDAGVTAKQIKLGASTVTSGAGSSFLGPVVAAMNAVVSKTNSSGGICGRLITLVPKDSGWHADAGFEIIRNLVQGEKVFALAVNPDSEGLDFATAQNYLAQHAVPVIGTDGLLISQYKDPYVWPIAAPTVSAMYAIAKSQCDAHLDKFSIVFETTYRFGREGAKAYNLAAKACTGHDIDGYVDPSKGQFKCERNFCGILSGSASYNSEVSKYCQPSSNCRAGAVLLEPATALVWFNNGGPGPGSYLASSNPGALATPQPLFNASFAQGCQKTCDGLRVWTGFRPAIEKFANEDAVKAYARDVKGYDPSVDVTNQFVEGGYLGMLLTVKALTAASQMPSGLTRRNVVATLDSLVNFDNGLTVRALSWKPGNHFAETTVHAFDEQYGDTGFGGWRFTGLEVTDPDPFAATK
jgi:ABC-type branched-subunit amino acid transport system substrate-binding protein